MTNKQKITLKKFGTEESHNLSLSICLNAAIDSHVFIWNSNLTFFCSSTVLISILKPHVLPLWAIKQKFGSTALMRLFLKMAFKVQREIGFEERSYFQYG